MQYAILCYHDEKVTCAWSKEHDDAVMAKLGAVMEKHKHKIGPVARLLPTTAATTLRKDREPGHMIGPSRISRRRRPSTKRAASRSIRNSPTIQPPAWSSLSTTTPGC
jgi:hypothetical protein